MTARGASRLRFLRGQRVELAAVTHGYLRFRPEPGQLGTVDFTDSLGTVHVVWDSGKRFGILAEDNGLLRLAGPDAVVSA